MSQLITFKQLRQLANEEYQAYLRTLNPPYKGDITKARNPRFRVFRAKYKRIRKTKNGITKYYFVPLHTPTNKGGYEERK